MKASRGVTIPELTMRTWVIQPGFMITHWQHIQHAGLSSLGAITLTAAFVATFYTTASDALVSPHLKYGKWENKIMWGLVQASYANPYYIEDNCQTPITTTLDPHYAATTCLSIEHAGEGIKFRPSLSPVLNSLQHTTTPSRILIHGQLLGKEEKVLLATSLNALRQLG